MKKVIVFLADGFEEVEAVTPIDFLRRAECDVFIAGVTGKMVEGAHGLLVEADGLISDIPQDADAVVIPGGMPGAENIADSAAALNIISSVFDRGGLVASICASPGVVLSRIPILNTRKATCYPGFQKYFPDDATYLEESVVVDGNLITSRGPGTALSWAIELVKYLAGDEVADNLMKGALIS
ncbi:MAG: DJ-1/PfpI family protein [Spirochaetales bacterium]|nr:DJ-1/PfpI family protein [Spirochaetales bacterium]